LQIPELISDRKSTILDPANRSVRLNNTIFEVPMSLNMLYDAGGDPMTIFRMDSFHE
jgi:hypothetical protein